MAVLLNPRPCLYHSLILLSVDFLVRSNMNRIATASLQTSGSMFTNSRWPPKSHIENVISVLRIEIVFSMKLTPVENCQQPIKKEPRSMTYQASVCNPRPNFPPRI